MGHKTIAELRIRLEKAHSMVHVGASYNHYKDMNKQYLVTGLSILEATDEVAVRYAMVDKPDVEFVRALSVWLQTVEWEGQTVDRFQRLA